MTDSLLDAARRVVHNAYDTRPRHRATLDGCRGDCIPCGLIALAAAVRDHDRSAGRDEDRMLAMVAVELAPPRARTR